MFTQLQELIPKIAQKKKMWKIISSTSSCHELQNIINYICHDNMAKPKVLHLRKMKVTIQCENSSCMQELDMLREVIWEQIRLKKLDK